MSERVPIDRNALNRFSEHNPSFDLQDFNFFDPSALDRLKWGGNQSTLLPQLKGLQRLKHITPNEEHAIQLYNMGLDSCFQISSLTKQNFLNQYREAFDDKQDLALATYQKAVSRKSQLTLHYMNIVNHKEPHYQALHSNNLSVATDVRFEHLPSYGDLFGGLDFCSVESCRSIFSPAAYLVDLVRFKEVYLNDQKVASQNRLDHRRPDLASILLDCENTDTLLPKLSIVNRLLEGQIYQNLSPSTLYAPTIYLPFNNRYEDQSGNNHQITLIGETPHYVEGRLGGWNALKFDNSFYLSTDFLNFDQYSFTAWVRLESGEGGCLLDEPSKSICFGFQPGLTLSFRKGIDSYLRSEQSRLTPNRWHHVAVTIFGCTTRLYLDGRDVGGGCIQDLSIQAALRIGRDLDGIVDQLSIYPTALSPGKIATLAQQSPQDQVYAYLSNQVYPFATPFNLPLERIRTSLAQLKSSLPDLWRTLNPPDQPLPASIERETLGLSPAELGLYTQEDDGLSRIREVYGLDSTIDPLDSTNGLANVTILLSKTGMSYQELNELLFEDLSESEILSELNHQFFINRGSLPSITFDPHDSNHLTNLDLPRLDRIHRFVRLSRKIGLSFTDVNWALRHALVNYDNNANQIIAQAIPVLANLKIWQQAYSLSINQLSTIFGLLKDYGKDEGESFFDTIFNQLSLDNGLVLPDNQIKWTVNPTEEEDTNLNQTIKSTLIGALGLNENELVSIGLAVVQAYKIVDGKLPLGLEQLSVLYRLSWIPKALSSTVSETLQLMNLSDSTKIGKLAGPPSTENISSFNQLVEIQQWFQGEDIQLEELSCILTGNVPLSSGLYLGHNIVVNLLNSLYTATQSVRITQSTLQSNPTLRIPGVTLDAFYQQLVTWNLISSQGLVLEVPTRTHLIELLEQFAPTEDAQTIEALAEVLQNLLIAARQLQDKTLANTLSIQFGIDSNAVSAIVEWVANTLNEASLLQSLLAFLFNRQGLLEMADTVPQTVLHELDLINRYSCLARVFRLTYSELRNLLENPEFYNISNIHALTLVDIQRLSDFKKLVNTYQDHENGFIHYFTHVSGKLTKMDLVDLLGDAIQGKLLWSDLVTRGYINGQGLILEAFKLLTGPDDANFVLGKQFQSQKDRIYYLMTAYADELDMDDIVEQLSKLTQWDPDQILILINHFWPSQQPSLYGTVEAVVRMKNSFDLRAQTSLNIAGLLQLDALKNQTDYSAFVPSSDALLGAIKGRYADTEWKEVYKPIQISLDQAKRDVLADYVIFQLQQEGLEGIATRRDLYEYFLIDVEVTGLVQTSVIKEAIGCLQLYIERARMNLETDLEFKDTQEQIDQYWSWMGSYRVWEANRKTFLYPENYIQPELRKQRTELFNQLIESLQQTHIDQESVTIGVNTYLDGFAAVANLKFAGAYLEEIEDPTQTNYLPQNLYLLNRTYTQPYQYYYRTARFDYDSTQQTYLATQWSPWFKIEQAITAKFASPVYAFNRLFVFWVDIKPAPAEKADNSIESDRFNATIQYSFYNFNKNWTAPQTLGEPILLPKEVNTRKKAEAVQWQRIEAITREERIIVQYSSLLNAVLDINLNKQVHALVVNISGSIPNNIQTEGTIKYVEDRYGRKSAFKFDKTNYLVSDKLVLGQDYSIALWVNISNVQYGALVKTRQTTLIEIKDNHQLYVNGVEFNSYIRSDEWHHIAVTVSLDKTAVYLDGQPQSSSTKTALGPINDEVLEIANEYDGSMDEILVFDFSLTSGQVHQLNDWQLTATLPQPNGFNALPAVSTNYPITGSLLLIPDAYYPLAKNLKNITENNDYPNAQANNPTFAEIEGRQSYYLANDGGGPISINNLSIDHDFSFSFWVYGTNFESRTFIFGDPSLFAIISNQKESLVWNPTEGPIHIITKLSNLVNDQWCHFAITGRKVDQNKYSLNFFFNGEYMSSYNLSSNDISFTQLQAGAGPGFSDFVGYYSDIMIFDRVLQLSEVQTLYDQQSNEQLISPNFNRSNWHGWSILDTGKSEYLSIPQYPVTTSEYHYIRLNSLTIHTLSDYLFANGVQGLFSIKAQETPEDSFSALEPDPAIIVKPWPSETLDFTGANGLYYWELFFHTPFLVANICNAHQQFEMVKTWYQYIYNPTVHLETSETPEIQGEDQDDPIWQDQFWQFVGLRSSHNPTLRKELTESPSKELEQDLTSQSQLAIYHNDPFDPQAIAALRPIAYQKTIVMHYIDNLIDWGDYFFRLNTRESLVEATMLYVMAYDLLGQRPANSGPCDLPAARTLGDIKDHYANGKIPEFLIDLEQLIPTKFLPEVSDNPNNAIPNIYFGIPENDKFIQYWDLVESRLYNIRHNLDIAGNLQHLPLFQPPIPPDQLIKAVASGLGVSQALAEAMAPVPYYRYGVLVEKARNATSVVVQFGNALLNALEKKDAEYLASLRTTHEEALMTMTQGIKDEQFKAAQSTLQSLQAGLAGAQVRYDHYDQLIRQGLSSNEQKQFSLETAAIALQGTAQVIKGVAAVSHLIPTVFGLAAGDFKPGDAINQGAMILEGTAGILNQEANMTVTLAQYQRRAEDWELQKAVAQEDMKQIQEQIQAAQYQLQIAQMEITLLETNISQVQEIEAFLRTKFTNQELYQWMIGKLAALYFQVYQIAYNLAMSAQRAWQFELSNAQTFVNPGNWSDLHKGLLAGEALLLDLMNMDRTYLEQNKRRLEIVKTISLKSLNQSAFEKLKTTEECQFSITKEALDADYSTLYSRRIKTLSLSIPAVLGPYQDIHATLTQESNKIDLKDGTLKTDGRADQQILLSQGIDDSGLFELNFHDERYLPFEGTGAISDWKLEMPQTANPGLLESLTDVIIKLRYTAMKR